METPPNSGLEHSRESSIKQPLLATILEPSHGPLLALDE